jgi:hypothetical protein
MIKEQKIIEGIQWTRGVIIVTGAASCGIAGVTGYAGIVAYFFLHLLSSLLLLVRMKCQPALYVHGLLGTSGNRTRIGRDAEKNANAKSNHLVHLGLFLISGLPDNILSFVLVWTAFYAFTEGV